MAQANSPWAPGSYFRAWELEVSDWASLLTALDRVNFVAGDRKLVWRGVHNESYGLLSSEYRWLKARDGKLPTEARMTALETEILSVARVNWADRGGSALETLAHIQHYGGPTRLLDVSHNPMIAAFFATERKYDPKNHQAKPDVDGRLFAFQANGRSIELDGIWGTRELPWADPLRPIKGWREELPFVWDPPAALNQRITAQQGAFLVGGVPRLPKGQNSRYRPPGAWESSNMKTMPASEIRRMTSVSLWMKSLSRKTQANSFATYTLRITADAKKQIRGRLKRDFDFHHGSIYPDRFGLATYGAELANLT